MSTRISEYTTPGEIPLSSDENLTSTLWEHEADHPNHAILSYREGNSFAPVTYAEMASRVRRLAAGLMGLGLEPGSRVCIFSPTRYEFTIIDYAIWAAACATVTIYETSSADQVKWIVSDSGADVVIVADEDLRATFDEATADFDDRPLVFTIDSGGLDELIEKGEQITDDEVMARAASAKHDDLATLVYTSGTTGLPKGCELTVRNFLWTVRQAMHVLRDVINMDAVTLMFLPLAHSFARIVQVGSVTTGGQIAFSTGIPNLMEELQIVRPTWLFAVPRVFEKVFNGASIKAHTEGKGKIFDLAAATAGNYSREEEAGKIGLKTRLMHAIFDKLVYARLRDALGGRLKHAVSGGAALGERLGHFFAGIGVEVLEGYGLTETSAAYTVNPPGNTRIGTVGKPLPGGSAAIAHDGEVLLKGGNVFRGYWKNDEATAEAIDDEGWFHTGDLGSLEDGYLRITGRKKEIIVTAGGKNVAPNVLEDGLRSHPLVSQTIVVGDNKPFIGALITIDEEEFPRWAELHGVETPLSESLDNPVLIEAIQEAVDRANKAVSKAESIRNFRILPVDFTIEGGELTPTLKVKRRIVHDRYDHEIEALYQKK